MHSIPELLKYRLGHYLSPNHFNVHTNKSSSSVLTGRTSSARLQTLLVPRPTGTLPSSPSRWLFICASNRQSTRSLFTHQSTPVYPNQFPFLGTPDAFPSLMSHVTDSQFHNVSTRAGAYEETAVHHYYCVSLGLPWVARQWRQAWWEAASQSIQ